jgi:hypothetical protein
VTVRILLDISVSILLFDRGAISRTWHVMPDSTGHVINSVETRDSVLEGFVIQRDCGFCAYISWSTPSLHERHEILFKILRYIQESRQDKDGS